MKEFKGYQPDNDNQLGNPPKESGVGNITIEGVLLETMKPLEVKRPKIVCLCGSTKFKDLFVKAQLQETLKGKIVLTIGCDLRSDEEIFKDMTSSEIRLTKAKLDVLHFAKIDLADEVLILNAGGYIGESTEREIEYAHMRDKEVKYYEN